MSNTILLKCLNALAGYLAKRDHSELELQQKLSRRFEKDIVEAALAEAREMKWLLPPEELAEKVKEALGRRNKGSRYIQQYLKKKGLPAVRFDDEEEYMRCLQLLESRFGPSADLDWQEKQKVFRFLTQRGFSSTAIRSALGL